MHWNKYYKCDGLVVMLGLLTFDDMAKRLCILNQLYFLYIISSDTLYVN